MKYLIKKKKLSAVLAGLCVMVMSSSSAMAAADEDGCWSGRSYMGSCASYVTWVDDDTTYIRISNNCTERLYVRWKVGTRSGTNGIKGGESSKEYEYVTGFEPEVWAVGSNNWQNDWICHHRQGGWTSSNKVPK